MSNGDNVLLPDWYGTSVDPAIDEPLSSDPSVSDGGAGTSVDIFAGLGQLASGIGRGISGVLTAQTAQQSGAIIDPRTGRLIAIGGKPVYSYAPGLSLGGLTAGGGGGLLLLVVLGLVAWFVVKQVRKS